MLIAVFGDVHGNLPALELFLKHTRDVDTYISLGDIVNFGPWSNECVQVIEEMNCTVRIKGNHEDYFLTERYSGSNVIAKTFFEHCIDNFSQQKKISKYVADFYLNKYYVTHTIDNMIIFEDTNIEIQKDTIVGHSHKQYITRKGSFTLVNPGSIGQNRDYINVINYLLWNVESLFFERCQLVYDVGVVIDEMKRRRYPRACIEYYEKKKRI